MVIVVKNSDRTTLVQHFTMEETAIMLDPDVQRFFPDAEAVNHALRTLIDL